MCLEFTSNNNSILFINVYLPCDTSDNLDDFVFCLAKANSIIDSHPCNHACIIGDFNANLIKGCNSLFGKELTRFCKDEQLVIADKTLCDNSTFTFYSDAHNTVSWLDHAVVTNNLFNAIKSIHVDNGFVTSDHFPLSVSFELSCVRVECNNVSFNNPKIPWDRLSSVELSKYKLLTDDNLKSVQLNHSLLLCDNAQCNDHSHVNAIDHLYNDIKNALIVSSQDFIKDRVMLKDGQPSQIAGWKEYCSASHSEARAAFLHWAACKKPRHGPSFEDMKRTRAYFKYTLRQCRENVDRVKSDNLAKKLISKRTKDFWKEVNKLKGSASTPLTFTIDNTCGQQNICSLWKSHYENILNSSANTVYKNDILNKIQCCTAPDNPFVPIEVSSVIKELKNGKACGGDGLQSEHFKFGSDKLSVLLCLLFNSMILHGYICQELMDTILIPIVKDKKGNVSSKDNYRPIAITSVISKILESVILIRFQDCLLTNCNQFGFKTDHATDLCTFTLKQITDYYNYNSSPVYICYLDASKAFDRLNFWILFDKLLRRGMPVIIVRLLVYWYSHQKFMVRWGSCVSEAFEASNGVRQGGVLSPYLFNIYMDGLSDVLNNVKIGCSINNVMTNHLMYADDTVLIAPSARALQSLCHPEETYFVRDFFRKQKPQTINCSRFFQFKRLMHISTGSLPNTLFQRSTQRGSRAVL